MSGGQQYATQTGGSGNGIYQYQGNGYNVQNATQTNSTGSVAIQNQGGVHF